MSMPADQMELREEEIRAHYEAASGLLDGLDHTPRIAKAKVPAQTNERSPGIPTRRRFRATTPGLVTRSTARPEGVHLIERIEGSDGGDPLISPVQASTLHALRRALAIALAIGEGFSEQTGLAGLKRDNLEGGLAKAKSTEFGELLAAEGLVVLHVFANVTSFLLAPHTSEITVEIGAVEEMLTDNAGLALHGALWELDQEIATFADSEEKLVATVMAYAEQLMEKAAKLGKRVQLAVEIVSHQHF